MLRPSAASLQLTLFVAFGLSAGACIIDVPDVETGTFACDTDDDCAKNYFCKNNLCVTDNGGDSGCRYNPCPDGKICAKRSDGTSHCLESCDDYYGCPGPVGRDAACIMTWVYDQSGKEIEGRICVGCSTSGCQTPQRCHLTKNDASGFTDKMETGCFESKLCANNEECMPVATLSACIKRGAALGGNECWPRPDACSSNPHLRSKMELDNAGGMSTDVCVACLAPLCENGQRCIPPTAAAADGTTLLLTMTSCECDEALCDQDKATDYSCQMNRCEPP